jgi:hypothetical protein
MHRPGTVWKTKSGWGGIAAGWSSAPMRGLGAGGKLGIHFERRLDIHLLCFPRLLLSAHASWTTCVSDS